jgi:hypothetical protein
MQMGPTGYFDAACAYVLPAEVVARIPYGELELVLATNSEANASNIALKGPYHDLLTAIGGPTPAIDTIVEMFGDFNFADTPTGFLVSPAKGSDLQMAWEDATLVFDEVGALSVPDPGASQALAPTGEGTKTAAGGELWQVNVADDTLPPDIRYVVGFETVMCELKPARDAADASLSDWLDSLHVEWL